jgi:hypothetical protein
MASINATHKINSLGITVKTVIIADDGECILRVRCNTSSHCIWTVSFTDYDGAYYRWKTDDLPGIAHDAYNAENIMHVGRVATACVKNGHGWAKGGRVIQRGFASSSEEQSILAS